VTRGLRARKKEQTRTAITEAALDLFEMKGFDATTVEDIADASNVSARTFFRYFDSKMELVFPGKGEDEPSIADVLETRPPSESPVEAMHNVVREKLAELLDEHGETTMRQMRIVMANPPLRALAVEHSRYHRAEMAAAFAERMRASPDDLRPHVLAAAVAEATWVILERWEADGADPRQLGAMIDETFGLLRNGFG
jgi:AcrR family transcriptional regulator